MTAQPKTRNAVQRAAWERNGGKMADRRTRRNRSRSDRRRRALQEQQS